MTQVAIKRAKVSVYWAYDIAGKQGKWGHPPKQSLKKRRTHLPAASRKKPTQRRSQTPFYAQSNAANIQKYGIKKFERKSITRSLRRRSPVITAPETWKGERRPQSASGTAQPAAPAETRLGFAALRHRRAEKPHSTKRGRPEEETGFAVESVFLTRDLTRTSEQT